MTVFLVGGVAWVGSHDLNPRKPIASTVKPLRVQVASLDWKWLFIYPDEGVASVNYLAIPVGTPVSFELTSSGVMNSFFVPQLGSQIYTMAGMVTRLELQADHPGTYRGLSAQYSGNGFADMRFSVDAVSAEDFARWVAATRSAGLPLDQPIGMGATAFMVLLVAGILGWVTLKGYWSYLWREWLTSVDHKRIGVMYIVLALLMLLRGFSDAIMMRAQQAVAAGGAQGYLPPEHFDQVFSAHGTIMIFFMAMPFVVGLMNFAVPLQLGIRDVAFPTLNSVSFWLTAAGALLIN